MNSDDVFFRLKRLNDHRSRMRNFIAKLPHQFFTNNFGDQETLRLVSYFIVSEQVLGFRQSRKNFPTKRFQPFLFECAKRQYLLKQFHGIKLLNLWQQGCFVLNQINFRQHCETRHSRALQ